MTATRPRSKTLAATLLAVIAFATLAACGQKGPLVLPDEAATRARTTTPSRADDGERGENAARNAPNDRRRTDHDDDETEDGADSR